jgi:pentapeptide repeat protein
VPPVQRCGPYEFDPRRSGPCRRTAPLATLNGADPNLAHFAGVDLAETRLTNAKLTFADLEGAIHFPGPFTPGRTALLAAQLPASAADAAARRDQQAAALAAQVRKLDAQQDAQVRALEDVPDGPAAKAMRARINERFTQLHAERTAAEDKLNALASLQPKAADSAILDEVPYAGDILPALPPALKARLFAVFDLAILWNKENGQATVAVTITDDTLAALPEILDPAQPGYHDTATDPRAVGVSARPSIAGPTAHGLPGAGCASGK